MSAPCATWAHGSGGRRRITMPVATLMQTVAANTMRHLTVLLRLGPALWAAVAAMVAYTGHGAIRVLRRG